MVLIAKDDCIEVFEIGILSKLGRKSKEAEVEIVVDEEVKTLPLLDKDGEPVKTKPKRKSKPKPPPENFICLLRSGRYKNEEQLRETLTSLFSERKKSDMLFLILRDKGPLKDWLVDNGFQYRVYEKRKGEEDANRNFRILNDAQATVAFINRKSIGDEHWDFITAFREMNKHLHLVYDESGRMWDKRRLKRPATPYAQNT